MENKTDTKTGLFIVSYQIGGDNPGAPTFIVHFSVYTPDETLSGFGQITRAINPPTDIPTQFDEGRYTHMCIMPKVCHIHITTKGHVPNELPQNVNVYLTMVVSEDWKSGTANYKYLDNKGKWHKITNAPVKVIPNATIE